MGCLTKRTAAVHWEQLPVNICTVTSEAELEPSRLLYFSNYKHEASQIAFY